MTNQGRVSARCRDPSTAQLSLSSSSPFTSQYSMRQRTFDVHMSWQAKATSIFRLDIGKLLVVASFSEAAELSEQYSVSVCHQSRRQSCCNEWDRQKSRYEEDVFFLNKNYMLGGASGRRCDISPYL